MAEVLRTLELMAAGDTGKRLPVSASHDELDAIAYGFFIPIFFICSGMSLDIDSIAENPARLIAFFVLMLGGVALVQPRKPAAETASGAG